MFINLIYSIHKRQLPIYFIPGRVAIEDPLHLRELGLSEGPLPSGIKQFLQAGHFCSRHNFNGRGLIPRCSLAINGLGVVFLTTRE